MVLFPGRLPAVLPDNSLLRLDEILQHVDGIVMSVSVSAGMAACPLCGTSSSRIHSRYTRTLRDLPWQGTRVRLRLCSRRFFCPRQDCSRSIFTERLPSVTQRYSRRTERLTKSVEFISYALGGEAGFRLAQHLGFECSADMLLRLIKSAQARAKPVEKVRVVGIDDWAWRKRQRYGTILVDLEKRCPLDILPDRSAETVEAWLRQHPEIEIVSRDRAGAYAEASANGAPQAIQVADRWHLLCNLTQVIQRMLERLGNAVRQLRPAEATPQQPATLAVREQPPGQPNRQTVSEQRRHRRMERYEAVVAAHQRGSSQRAIARELNLTPKTVSRFLRSGEFPEQAPRHRRSWIQKYQPYLEQRWTEGCHNASQLFREIQKQGYTGKITAVRDFLHSWRTGTGPQPHKKPPSVRAIAFWLARPDTERTPEQKRWAEAITRGCAEAATAETLANEFREQLIVTRTAAGLAEWLRRAVATNIAEFRGFALGIERDYNAVVAAFDQPWSNGQVEGQVHRLKALKRQMYGRAGFHLLRARVLPQYAVSVIRSQAP